MSVVLTVDIGNTRAKYAVFDGEKIDDTGVFDPEGDDLAVLLSRYPSIKRGIISSVGGHVEECLSRCGSLEMVVLSDKTRLPFKISLPNTSQIGADRLAAMASAAYFKPSKNVLVIDIGTCITYDILTDDGFIIPDLFLPGLTLGLSPCTNILDCFLFAVLPTTRNISFARRRRSASRQALCWASNMKWNFLLILIPTFSII